MGGRNSKQKAGITEPKDGAKKDSKVTEGVIAGDAPTGITPIITVDTDDSSKVPVPLAENQPTTDVPKVESPSTEGEAHDAAPSKDQATDATTPQTTIAPSEEEALENPAVEPEKVNLPASSTVEPTDLPIAVTTVSVQSDSSLPTKDDTNISSIETKLEQLSVSDEQTTTEKKIEEVPAASETHTEEVLQPEESLQVESRTTESSASMSHDDLLRANGGGTTEVKAEPLTEVPSLPISSAETQSDLTESTIKVIDETEVSTQPSVEDSPVVQNTPSVSLEEADSKVKEVTSEICTETAVTDQPTLLVDTDVELKEPHLPKMDVEDVAPAISTDSSKLVEVETEKPGSGEPFNLPPTPADSTPSTESPVSPISSELFSSEKQIVSDIVS